MHILAILVLVGLVWLLFPRFAKAVAVLCGAAVLLLVVYVFSAKLTLR